MLELFAPTWREVWAGEHESGDVGVVYTKPEIVEVILDLAGYRPDVLRLSTAPLLEPSCGDGAFLNAVVRRLIESERLAVGEVEWSNELLDQAIRAVDLSAAAVSEAQKSIVAQLVDAGCPKLRARQLAKQWAVEADFLLSPWEPEFAFVVGNPPYVRLEDLPKRVLVEYRRRFATLTDRADVYIAFFEQGLRLLRPDGVLAFICANRFAKNQYGTALRRVISSRFRVRHYINLEHTQPFLSDVSAYPAIVTIDRQVGSATLATTLSDVEPKTLESLRRQGSGASKRGPLARFAKWYPDGAPWSTTSRDEAQLLSSLSAEFSLIEDSGAATKVGIGVATGADGVFVLDAKHPEIEDDRQIPLAVSADVSPQRIEWSGRYLVNPFDAEDSGKLVDLPSYPGLSAYFDSHRSALSKRHVAEVRPRNWYRTIDRIWPKLTTTPKLLIPDIQLGGNVALDTGAFYPHHNLYWITSGSWPLAALQALLRSSHVLLQIRAFSVQMRGGSVRYQAQTLRRVRVPLLSALSATQLAALSAASQSADQAEIDEAASSAFGFAAPSVGAARA
ncbi:MAG: Eco57I restriction-modification methylase domain-containing protein [Steroidobacteraceae bacterium]|nr:Eco57I restriction-modification methylase domain-containing protein [Steroidobacteraceae bacterium]